MLVLLKSRGAASPTVKAVTCATIACGAQVGTITLLFAVAAGTCIANGAGVTGALWIHVTVAPMSFFALIVEKRVTRVMIISSAWNVRRSHKLKIIYNASFVTPKFGKRLSRSYQMSSSFLRKCRKMLLRPSVYFIIINLSRIKIYEKLFCCRNLHSKKVKNKSATEHTLPQFLVFHENSQKCNKVILAALLSIFWVRYHGFAMYNFAKSPGISITEVTVISNDSSNNN